MKLTKLQTESDWNIQNGFEQILRGIFQAVRNPRSHEKYDDIQANADSIILFIDYLLKIIDKSKTQFSVQEIIERVYDDGFVESDEYANLIIAEIPVKKRLDTLIEVYNAKNSNINVYKLTYFFRNILNTLTEDELRDFFKVISTDLKTTNDIQIIRLTVASMHDHWEKIDKISRLRAENKFIKALDNARYFKAKGQYSSDGAFCTWLTNILEVFSFKKELINALQEMISSSDEDKVEFFIKWGFYILKKLQPEPDFFSEMGISSRLQNGDTRFYNLIKYSSDAWKTAFEEDLKNFVAKEESNPIDDLPF